MEENLDIGVIGSFHSTLGEFLSRKMLRPENVGRDRAGIEIRLHHSFHKEVGFAQSMELRSSYIFSGISEFSTNA